MKNGDFVFFDDVFGEVFGEFEVYDVEVGFVCFE